MEKTTLHGRNITIVAATKASADAAAGKFRASSARAASNGGALATTNRCYGAGVLCLFSDGDGGGDIAAFDKDVLFRPGFINLRDVPRGAGNWNDVMSSWSNDIGGDYGAATMCWWVDFDGGGAGHLMRPLGATIQNVLPSETIKRPRSTPRTPPAADTSLVHGAALGRGRPIHACSAENMS
ncbi:peptidase inhibitor family I36 protein [Krasilnikovia sp. MM14-A1259]|uniref:peptidase inhibitor family I36 protein n=1 Tax=Krasilnikovia sp. MM14-A1259 TaxID=3373539 RepID=UPI0037FCE948